MTFRLQIALGLSLIASQSAQAATINADSVSRDDVNTAIGLAVTGDTVQIPAGTAYWTTGLSIPSSKNITLQGAGIGSTVITQASTLNTAIILTVSRVSGITFYLSSSDWGQRVIFPKGRGWRIDHCEFRNMSHFGQAVEATHNPHPYGLIDNCYLYNCRVLVTSPYDWTAQHSYWAAPTTLGTANTIVIEDCTLELTNPMNSLDGNYGAHYVIRYCTILDSQVQAHGVQMNNRAVRKWEIYNNTFIQTNRAMWTPIFMRAGTGVIFSNTLVGTWSSPQVTFDVNRGITSKGDGGRTDGASIWDGNTTNGIDQATGTHTGSDNAATLTDSTKSWTVDGFLLTVNSENFNRWVYNVTDGSRGRITNNTATTITVTLSGGTDNDWDTGDEYYISGGYPSRDQIGRGQDVSKWTTWWSGTAPEQASEPVYIWGQTGFSGVSVSNGAQTRFLIQEGRDYIIGTPKPGYTPLRYPHPLRQGEVAPPEGLQKIISN